jgi:hypothetical protein
VLVHPTQKAQLTESTEKAELMLNTEPTELPDKRDRMQLNPNADIAPVHTMKHMNAT